MSTQTLTPKQDMEAKLARAGEIAKQAEDEERDFTDAERVEVKQLVDDAYAIRAKLEADKRKRDRVDADAALVEQLKALSVPISKEEAEALNDAALKGGSPTQPNNDGGSIADRFLKSEPWQQFVKAHPGGRIGREGRVSVSPVDFGSSSNLFGSKAVIGSTTAWRPTPMDIGLQLFPWGRELTIRDVITTGQTTSDAVEYARQLTITNAAAPVPESTTDAVDATPTLAEGYKPQSALTFEKVTTVVVTIAHWLAATKRTLSDVGQIRTLIDSFLRFGLEEELEDQIVSGDGTGENFDGILTVTGTQAQAFSTNPIETIRKALTKVRTVGRARPTAVALNPADDEALDLAKDTTNRYYGAGPFGTGPSTIWGYPRIVTEAVPAGTAIVADWRFAALWDREQTTISVTDSHADFFIRNLVAILAEMRAAFGVIRPSAFVIADLTA